MSYSDRRSAYAVEVTMRIVDAVAGIAMCMGASGCYDNEDATFHLGGAEA